jgi:peptidyl-dipeptidase A
LIGPSDPHTPTIHRDATTEDNNWLAAHADAEATALGVLYAKEAARFDRVQVDKTTRRKLDLLKRQLTLPAPSRPGAAQELSDIAARLANGYSTAKLTFDGKTLTLDDAEDSLRTSRDPAATRALWERWRAASGPSMKSDYVHLVQLSNEGACELGYRDTGEFWRSWYDMPPDQFAHKMDALFSQVKPLYDSLHCYVRAKLNQKYGPQVQPSTGPIRADLLGNMGGQWWSNIYDIVAPSQQTLISSKLTPSPPTQDRRSLRCCSVRSVADSWERYHLFVWHGMLALETA